MPGMTNNEQRRLIKIYLGVSGGYLAGISDINVLESFCIQCDLDVDPRKLEGTNRAKFEQILANSLPKEQARIVRRCLKENPPDSSDHPTRTTELHDEFVALADRLDGICPVGSKKPAITSAVVELAINDAEKLLESTGATSAVDRLHTVLHGYLQAICDDEGITYNSDLMSGLFGKIRQQHPAFVNLGPRSEEVLKVFRSLSTIMDQLNPIRNESSVAHPNKDLLDPPEAALVINITRTILHYLDMKISAHNDA